MSSEAQLESTPSRSRRKASGEVRRLLLEAARDIFPRKGYAGTSTREIAQQADVSETLVFRHFGNKAGLFEAAIFEPFREFIDAFISKWEPLVAGPVSVEGPIEALSVDYLAGLYRLLREQRDLLILILSTHAYEVGVLDDLANHDSPLSVMLDSLEALVTKELDRMGLAGVDALLATRVAFGMVAGVAMMDEWLFPPGGKHPSEARIVNELVGQSLYGIIRTGEVGNAQGASPQLDRPRTRRFRGRR